MFRKRNTPLGFTLVELLIVMAIIGILVGLMLPALSAVREAARKTQCRNNVKQIGVAILAHDEARGAFPSGGDRFTSGRAMYDGQPVGIPGQTWSWAYQILPYLDQTALWQQTDNALVRAAPVPGYSCPSRRGSTIFAGAALLDYAGNGGYGEEYDTTHNGPIVRFEDARITNALIRDGTSSTLLVGEKFIFSNAYTGGTWGDEAGYFSGWGWDTIRFGRQPPQQDKSGDPKGPAFPGGTAGVWDYFGSAHSGGFHGLLCDGSVRVIKYSIDAQVLEYLCNRSDGQSFDATEL